MSEINHDKVASIKAPKLRREDKDRARLTVAANATSVEDCATLLDMLGLLPAASERQERKAS